MLEDYFNILSFLPNTFFIPHGDRGYAENKTKM